MHIYIFTTYILMNKYKYIYIYIYYYYLYMCINIYSFLASNWASRAVAAAPSFQTCFACVHIYNLYACVYICVCVYVCEHDTCIYMPVCMYLYTYAFIHMCMYMCMHICV